VASFSGRWPCGDDPVPEHAKKSVLVVMSEGESRNTLALQLRSLGYDAVQASGMPAALAVLGEDAPRMAIIDWDLPDMAGQNLCRSIRANEAIGFLYVVVLMERPDEDALTGAFHAGADDVVAKPCHGRELRARLRAGDR